MHARESQSLLAAGDDDDFAGEIREVVGGVELFGPE